MLDVNKYLNENHYADVEAKGFWDDVNSTDDVWCFCSITDDDEVILWHDYPEYDNVVVVDPHDDKEYIIAPRAGSLLEGARYWYKIGQAGGKLIVHNLNSYDKPIIEKIWPKCVIPATSWHDTFNQSKLQWFDRPTPKGAKSPHGLKAYGIRFGILKPDVTDFTKMDAYMLHRVIEDCRIQKETYEYLEEERRSLAKIGVTFDECTPTENTYTQHCQRQEVRGTLIDVEHIKVCLAWLDKTTSVLATKIEPLLPPTVKVKSTRISRGDMATLLGFKNVPDRYNEDGEVIKDYYKPSTNFHKMDKTNRYSGFNLSYGDSPAFVKKRELTTWIKENHPDTKSKEWDIQKDEIVAELLNINTCQYFDVEPESDLILGPFTRVEFLDSKLSQHEVVKGYLIKLGLRDFEEWNIKKDSDGAMVRAERHTIVSFPKKASYENQVRITCKKGQVLYTSPKLSEKDYEQLPPGLGQEIAEYNTYMHRRRFLENPKDPENKGLMSYTRSDNRIPCGINNYNTSTGRSTHRVWVNAPGEGSLYGEEIRKSIIPADGYRLVGADMKSAQLAIAAYYAKNASYYQAVVSGNEEVDNDDGSKTYVGESAHCFSARLFDMVTDQEWADAVKYQDPALLHSIMLRRKGSKKASFGVIFGCAGKKLATMLKIPEREGNKKKEAFLSQMGLKDVIEWLDDCRGVYPCRAGWYIPLPMGFWAYCTSPHKSLNYLVQGTEGVCQKIAINYFEERLKHLGGDAHKVLDYHDEYLVEARDDIADKVGELMCEAYRYASDAVYEWHIANEDKFPNLGTPDFAFNLDGGYKVSKLGKEGNYLQTH